MLQPPRANGFRDTWAGTLDVTRAAETVSVAGWVHRRRDHGGLIFIDLRDRSGLLQLVFHPETSGEAFALAERLRPEHVVAVTGTVERREAQNINPNLATGEVEVSVTSARTLAQSETPPFPIDEETPVDEMLRLRYRWLDLRRQGMLEAMTTRSAIIRTMRGVLDERDFMELETPILTRSTPEGARDFLVPSRLSPGSLYALPQSPQLFKQLFMMAGYERYYQIARCFRDEDLRADRQPEFTQLDVEMAFVDEDDVIDLMEAVMGAVFAVTEFPVAAPPWPRLAYDDAVARFGNDRPDARFGLELRDVGPLLQGSDFKVFQGVLDGGGAIRALNAGVREMSRSELEGLNDVVRIHGAKAVAPIYATGDPAQPWAGNLAKFFSAEQMAAVNAEFEAGDGDLLLFVADEPRTAAASLGALRLHLGERFGLIPEGRHEALWITGFPMFERDESVPARPRWAALHHPFTAPDGDLDDPANVLSRAYDLVLDGVEIGGGSIRIHTPEVQQAVFEHLGLGSEEAHERFGFLLEALRYGAPPHGGIAMGIDRVAAIITGRESIRDVIAFPKTASGADPLTGAPAPVDARQLQELALRSLVEPVPEGS